MGNIMKYCDEKDFRKINAESAAKLICAAARTAPKAKGIDNLFISYFKKDDIQEISDSMLNYSEKDGVPGFFTRDAKNIIESEVLIVIGTGISSCGIPNCGLCGFANCGEKNKFENVPCAFNTGDLGIALGSAAETASRLHFDNRIMFSVGKFLVDTHHLPDDVKIAYAIPLSCTGKNPFFDRK